MSVLHRVKKSICTGVVLSLISNTPSFGGGIGMTGAVKPFVKKLDQKVQNTPATGLVHASFPVIPSFQIVGTVFKGPVVGSTVNLFSLNSDGSKGSLLATATTDASANFKFPLTQAPAYPLLVESTGGVFSNESNPAGASIQFPSNDVLSAVLPDQTVQVSVTPLTYMAAQRAVYLMAGGLSPDSAIKSALIGLGQQYNLSDVLRTRPVLSTDPSQVVLGDREQRRYGLLMAAITQVAISINVNPVDLAKGMANDASDGTLDGKNGNAAIMLPVQSGGQIALTGAMSMTTLQTALNTVIASTNNKTNIGQMTFTTTPVTIGVNGAGIFYVTNTTLPAFVAGKTATVDLTATGGTPPYTCSMKTGSVLPASFQLTSDCVLSGSPPAFSGGTTTSISPPFTITMADSAGHTQDFIASLTIVSPNPTFTVAAGSCIEGLPCTASLALSPTGGAGSPYYFVQDSLANGAPPIGMSLGTDGSLTGTPFRAGTYSFGVCVVDSIGGTQCQKTSVVVNETPHHSLVVITSGLGSGTVTWSPLGEPCTVGNCSATFPDGAVITFSAAPTDSNSAFGGWYGACSGTGPCTITMNGPMEVNGLFEQVIYYTPPPGGGGGGGGSKSYCTDLFNQNNPVQCKACTRDSDCAADLSAVCDPDASVGQCHGKVP